jgi:hypothetical protein
LNIFDEVREHIPFHEHAAAATGPQPGPKTLAQAVHRDLNSIGRVIAHGLPLLERIVANPQLDEFVELALKADGLGVCAEAFTAASDVLRAAMARTATGPQPMLEPLPQRTPGATLPGDVPSTATPPPVSSISISVPPTGVTQIMATPAADAPPVPPESSGEAATAGENHSGVTSDAPAPANGSPAVSEPQAPADGTEAQTQVTT